MDLMVAALLWLAYKLRKTLELPADALEAFAAEWKQEAGWS